MKKIVLILLIAISSSVIAQNFQFLGSYTSDGTPLYFATSDTISQATLDLVSNSLPENYPVPVYNPQYISSGYDTDLVIDSLADVWVTFVSEGAGYKNVLGFYTYDLNNPPLTAPTTADITIVFPNVSAAGSGGSLVTGNKVKIGTFPAGTGIGWVLLANGWNGSQVTNGLWRLFSNPSFNPESDPNLRNHNVLLNDPDNERIILGFEDIRRDNAGCDNDFNDAIFYVTANPYTALRTVNVADVSSRTDITSANDGGLESEGSLATLIAKRNFKRVKEQTFANRKQLQIPFKVDSSSSYQNRTGVINLNTLFPSTGMFGTETVFVSSPTDLIQITNAEEVFSVDYYEGTNRVAAVLGTKTTGGIYNHSKVICDRLNGSTLEDIRTINLKGYEIILSKIRRANGEVEFALHFSIEELATENKMHSYWNIGQYPIGNYKNFQIWGATMGQVSNIANYIIDTYNQQSVLIQNVVSNRIPTVFVKKGSYKDGKVKLTLINKSGANEVQLNGNSKETELTTEVNLTLNEFISTAYESEIELVTGNLFDIGFSITGNNSPQQDTLYLADGPWGMDYNTSETIISSFQLTNPVVTVQSEIYTIERNASVTGQVKGTANLFRNILPGELLFDASAYEGTHFSIQNSLPTEVILVTENTTDWNNRLRFNIPANVNMVDVAISFLDFTSPNGAIYNGEKIKGFVFSVKGDYFQFQPFSLQVSNLKLGSTTTLSTIDFETSKTNEIYNYPNPFSNETTIVLSENISDSRVQLIDVTGRIVHDKNYKVVNSNEIKFKNTSVPKGIYMFVITTSSNKVYSKKCIID
ncbi:DUF4114 domain-containing protein [Flavobacterium jejuense]|uniref:DUF4114 domain-containing protein n=1 Tax=Flavobacterium jejuense TaxID=1544455 RepID=A0ABX0ITS2_9FLAO|nr:DUF4114 domain-containing protein [Flavobacterium jejuense]NHN26611.1 DUF4114 domain-containing protein [Flavobacterium jejuense]